MKYACWLCGALVALGCSASNDEPSAPTGSAGGNGVAGAMPSGAAGANNAAGVSGVAGAVSAMAGGPSTAGSAGAGTSGAGGVDAGGGAGAAGAGTAGAGTAGAGTAGSAGGGGASSCTPNPSGSFTLVGETIHDAKTCLDWMKATKTGVNYAAAESFCADSTLAGFDDWRIPNVNEFASTVTACGKYPPEGPVDPKFDQQGDGYWTSTPAGEKEKVCAIGMANAGDYYHYGMAGPQVVRCVRGSGSVKTVKDCTQVSSCKMW